MPKIHKYGVSDVNEIEVHDDESTGSGGTAGSTAEAGGDGERDVPRRAPARKRTTGRRANGDERQR